jgi:tripartite-type tricarboxylate transporter receptor subunit TctC
MKNNKKIGAVLVIGLAYKYMQNKEKGRKRGLNDLIENLQKIQDVKEVLDPTEPDSESKKTKKQTKTGDYPNKPITIMVPFTPDTVDDYHARTVFESTLSQNYLGQPSVIINKPGNGGIKGWNSYAKAKKDGYDLATYNLPNIISHPIVSNTKYIIDNFEPIANWGADPVVLIVPLDSEFNSVDDLLKFANKNPRKVTFSGVGKFISHHIAFLQFAKATSTKLRYISKKNSVNALNAVKIGKVTAGFNSVSHVNRLKDDFKILAIADLQRDNTFLPNVPTFKELGINVDDTSVHYRGIMGPKGLDPNIISYLENQCLLMFNDKNTLTTMKNNRHEVRIMNRQQVQIMWEEKKRKLSKILKKSS